MRISEKLNANLTGVVLFLVYTVLVAQINIVQAVFITAVPLLMFIFGRKTEFTIRIIRGGTIISLVTFVPSIFLYMIEGWDINYYYAISELKVYSLFFLPIFFLPILSQRYNFGIPSIEVFYKILLIFYFILLLIGFLFFGLSRYTGIFGHSINISYVVLYLLIAIYSRLSFFWLALSALVVLMLGSTTSFAVLLGFLVFKSRLPKEWKFNLGISAVIIFLGYSAWYREKYFLTSGFSDFDRYQIYYYFIDAAGEYFSFLNYIIGWGLGREVLNEIPADFEVLRYWFVTEFAADGVYSFSTHSDYLRIFFNFGLLGVASLGYFLYKLLPREIFFVLACLAFFNTTIFSTPDIYVLSMLSAVYSLQRVRDDNF